MFEEITIISVINEGEWLPVFGVQPAIPAAITSRLYKYIYFIVQSKLCDLSHGLFFYL